MSKGMTFCCGNCICSDCNTNGGVGEADVKEHCPRGNERATKSSCNAFTYGEHDTCQYCRSFVNSTHHLGYLSPEQWLDLWKQAQDYKDQLCETEIRELNLAKELDSRGEQHQVARGVRTLLARTGETAMSRERLRQLISTWAAEEPDKIIALVPDGQTPPIKKQDVLDALDGKRPDLEWYTGSLLRTFEALHDEQA